MKFYEYKSKHSICCRNDQKYGFQRTLTKSEENVKLYFGFAIINIKQYAVLQNK